MLIGITLTKGEQQTQLLPLVVEAAWKSASKVARRDVGEVIDNRINNTRMPLGMQLAVVGAVTCKIQDKETAEVASKGATSSTCRALSHHSKTSAAELSLLHLAAKWLRQIQLEAQALDKSTFSPTGTVAVSMGQMDSAKETESRLPRLAIILSFSRIINSEKVGSQEAELCTPSVGSN